LRGVATTKQSHKILLDCRVACWLLAMTEEGN